MKKALIRSEEEREARRVLIIRNRQQRAHQSLHQNLDLVRLTAGRKNRFDSARLVSDSAQFDVAIDAQSGERLVPS